METRIHFWITLIVATICLRLVSFFTYATVMGISGTAYAIDQVWASVIIALACTFLGSVIRMSTKMATWAIPIFGSALTFAYTFVQAPAPLKKMGLGAVLTVVGIDALLWTLTLIGAVFVARCVHQYFTRNPRTQSVPS